MLREKVLDFEVGMYEQNVIAYLVKESPALLNHIEFETKYCINCWYASHPALFSPLHLLFPECPPSSSVYADGYS